ncbi:MAG: sulfite exporter TauE/SafE family protein [Ruminococcaceae bacterium]|nr:sulfite exporter TauE/SafE family protein [Oscillospiraceae bacterium]
MKIKKNTAKTILGGLSAGFVNGLLGSGGGMLAVPALERAGLPPRSAHSSSLAVILPLSAVSVFMYLNSGKVTLADALPYMPGGIIGALAGAWLMRRISPKLLRKIFGGFALWAGLRLLMRS